MAQKITYQEFRKAVASLSENKLYTFFGIGDKQEYLRSCEGSWNKLPVKKQEEIIKQLKIVSIL